MANLKKLLAGAMALCMAGAMFASCSGKDGSGSKEKTKGSDNSANTIRIYTWNDEFKSRLRNYYPEYDKDKSGFSVDADGNEKVGEHEYLKDGKEIVWVTTPSADNAYQNKLDTDLEGQAKSSEKIDMFLVEADYALKYVNGPYAMPISDLGITDAELADQYQYTKDIVTSNDGVLKGVSWQATPGLFAYRRDIAKEVLGTDDPNEVQAAISDWDKFNAVAAQMKDKGYFMLSGYDDSYRTFSNNVSQPWVDDSKNIVIDDNLMKWVDQTKEYTDKGYNNGTSLWADQWSADQSADGKVFGFFYSTWGINFTLAGNAKSNDLYYVCPGPQAYYWGGTWICAAEGTDNKETVADIMKSLTCNKDIMLQITKDTQDYTNNKAGMEELAADFSSEFLGGQNHIALFVDAAPKIDASKIGPYDQGLNEAFQAAFKDYFTGTVSKDEALANFYTKAKEKYPDLNTPA
ncbi:ABC transporter substrate-binding protein [Ruminococcus albus]|uniref:ABC-type glycerol-3-phosphate transport system, substrate-binding protein n=1 Tax=Ruminococcus albus TaxID=1264 RepID=A0A1H7LZD5_RUMAL|nr:ABC transporter substrate-binding protein [Ruminococcus albus]SEL04281.1 ABC-type glycerol-3-phosphate transport system, substrate-binding protein [Ruminococcus albus]